MKLRLRRSSRTVSLAVAGVEDCFGQVKTPKGHQHRLHTANQGAHCVKGVVRSSEDAQRASTPTTHRESRCALRKGGSSVK
eukprot:1590852-Pyramimonas_sp.AAC.1